MKLMTVLDGGGWRHNAVVVSYDPNIFLNSFVFRNFENVVVWKDRKFIQKDQKWRI